ncbi:MAG: DUF3467 domain-containing protein [Pirellulales bacterium]
MAEAKKISENAASTEMRTVAQPIDESKVQTAYANFFRVTNTVEEMIIDFGLNAATAETQHIPVQLAQRVVVNHYTAKRLLQALAFSIDRHEKAFGVVETNVQKRLAKQAPPPKT